MSIGDRLRTWAKRSETIRRWREQRYRMFLELCAVRPDERILDVGAGEGSALERFNSTNPIVAVDLETEQRDWLQGENVTVQQADGTHLPFGDRSFPIVFSNSVIEHVPQARQLSFAREIRRVGDRYFVQTPNRWFPIEPHYQMPFVQFLPERALRALNKRFTMGWRKKGEWYETTLLSASDLRRLFPDATIHRERVLGMTKSLMAVRGQAPSASSGASAEQRAADEGTQSFPPAKLDET